MIQLNGLRLDLAPLLLFSSNGHATDGNSAFCIAEQGLKLIVGSLRVGPSFVHSRKISTSKHLFGASACHKKDLLSVTWDGPNSTRKDHDRNIFCPSGPQYSYQGPSRYCLILPGSDTSPAAPQYYCRDASGYQQVFQVMTRVPYSCQAEAPKRCLEVLIVLKVFIW